MPHASLATSAGLLSSFTAFKLGSPVALIICEIGEMSRLGFYKMGRNRLSSRKDAGVLGGGILCYTWFYLIEEPKSCR
jgi:hypothetical protein